MKHGSASRSRLVRFGVIAALLLPAVVLTHAQESAFERFRPFRPNPQETGVAGSNGLVETVTFTAGRNNPLIAISLTESYDRPASAGFQFLNSSWDGSLDEPGWILGRMGKGWSSPHITAYREPSSRREVSIYEGERLNNSLDPLNTRQLRFVRGISVCQSSGALTNNNRVKGIRLWWGTVPAGATNTHDVTTRPSPKEFSRTNCNDNNGWVERQMCPARYVATGVKIQHHQNHGVVGFQLLCDIVEFASDEEGVAHWTRQQPIGGVRPPERRFEALPSDPPTRRR